MTTKPQHSPEPWSVDENAKRWSIFDRTKMQVCTQPAGDSIDRANARRIVACVNACVGISTENVILLGAMGQFGTSDALRAENARQAEQIKRLREALHEFQQAMTVEDRLERARSLSVVEASTIALLRELGEL